MSACGQNKEQNNKEKAENHSKIKAPVKVDYEPQVTVVKYEDLLQVLNQQNDTLTVVNFWATWCAPCVKELPHFVATAQEMKDKPVKLLLVSLDTRSSLESGVIPFIKDKNFVARHYLLDDNGRMNEWIPEIDAGWDGAIPATVLYKNGKKLRFDQGQLSESELKANIQSHL
ncbi:MAG: TlpA family protein disulfide reductase [Sphingobacteriales bacterium]|nr:MAG: TlpA family protein disulfide reductase [Sphingobacteriales bacterium]